MPMLDVLEYLTDDCESMWDAANITYEAVCGEDHIWYRFESEAQREIAKAIAIYLAISSIRAFEYTEEGEA